MSAMFATFAIQGAYLPLWFADRGLSAGSIGQILGVASLFRVLCGPAWGAVADRVGQRGTVLFLTALGATCGALLYLPSHGFVAILLVAAGQGMVSSALSPLIDAMALALMREGRMQYGPIRAWGSAAFMTATAAGGWLVGALAHHQGDCRAHLDSLAVPFRGEDAVAAGHRLRHGGGQRAAAGGTRHPVWAA